MEGETVPDTTHRTQKLMTVDWAIKNIFRRRENFRMLGGFLSELLEEDVTITKLLESDSNKQHAGSKRNQVDILCETQRGEYVIIEVQKANEWDYFKRMIFGVANLTVQNLEEAQNYMHIRKVISITIADFDLGLGNDYIYHGTTRFIGKHNGSELHLTAIQQIKLEEHYLYKVFPEYYIIKLNEFNKQLKSECTTLDEWIYLFRYSEMLPGSQAKGIQEANEKLNLLKMTREEEAEYRAYMAEIRNLQSASRTPETFYKELAEKEIHENKDNWFAEGEAQRSRQIARALLAEGEKAECIARITNLSPQEIETLHKLYTTQQKYE